MIEKKYKRTALRSPMNSQFIYSWDKKVLRSRTFNISQGGILLEAIPNVEVGDVIPIMMELPKIPIFANFKEQDIFNLDPLKFNRDIIRLKIEVVRIHEGPISFDKSIVAQMGGKFFKSSENLVNEINNYVDSYKKNVVFLLNLIADLGQGKKQMPLLSHIAYLLGYQIKDSISLLRQKVLHDYQSLEDF
ncbi:MAG: hypothetical protein E2O68_09500 [Deltaproteobacteria bacterium]|nr:MAG: hypothetical protein E2O68_09500 [Deltaproteobacteria bacterium]